MLDSRRNQYVIIIGRRKLVIKKETGNLHVWSQHLATSPNASISLARKLFLLTCNTLRLRDTVRAWFSYQLQPPVATVPLHSPSWKQHSTEPVILASTSREERSATHVDVELRRLPPNDFSRQESELVRKIQRRRLRSLCAAATSSKWRTFFRLAFTIREKSGN